jgi:hemolysin III
MEQGEKFNAITHSVGAILALLGSAVLIIVAVRDGDPWKLLSVTVYGATLVLLYSFSALYHSLHGRAKIILRELDHHSIYLLIAGSYTPFCLVTLRGPWGWSLFGAVWTLALLGIAQEIWLGGSLGGRGSRVLSLVIYIVMGWLALVAVLPLWRALKPAGFAWLLAGGAMYTIGILFYATDHKLRHGHGIWHLFVLGGSACHFFALLLHVA